MIDLSAARYLRTLINPACKRFVHNFAKVKNRREYQRCHRFDVYSLLYTYVYIRLFEKFLSFYKEIMNAQHFSFYIILSNYV